MIFEQAIIDVLWAEGVFSKDPRDPGNWSNGELRGTKYGISARSYPDVDIQNLTLEEARSIYRRDYWNTINGDAVANYSEQLSRMLFNLGVNCGVGRAGLFLQRAINVIASNDQLGIEVVRGVKWRQTIARLLGGKALREDGSIGPLTIAVLNSVPYPEAVEAGVFGEAYVHYRKGKVIYRAGWLNRLGRTFLAK